jgi:SAM-dependent methyltransferase
MKVEYIAFINRRDRTEYIARRFRNYLSGKVLDVGCDEAVLKKVLNDIDYIGIDIAGEPDIRLDLEKLERLPFEDDFFDCIVCSDVLEHLDNLHAVFLEMMRVSKKYLIISLPNNWVNARVPVSRGKGSIGHYGLPPEPPRDRHKWFFSLSEGLEFVNAQSRRHVISVVDILATEKPRPLLTRLARRIAYPVQMNYLNRYAHTLWAVFKK